MRRQPSTERKMTYFDEARALRAMIESRKLTQSKLAQLLGVSQSYVANKLRLLSLSPETEAAIIGAQLSERHARVVLRLPAEEERLALIDRIRVGKLSVFEADTVADIMLEDGMVKCPPGKNYKECIAHFERTVEASLRNLRAVGICASSEIDKDSNGYYMTIRIG